MPLALVLLVAVGGSDGAALAGGEHGRAARPRLDPRVGRWWRCCCSLLSFAADPRLHGPRDVLATLGLLVFARCRSSSSPSCCAAGSRAAASPSCSSTSASRRRSPRPRSRCSACSAIRACASAVWFLERNIFIGARRRAVRRRRGLRAGSGRGRVRGRARPAARRWSSTIRRCSRSASCSTAALAGARLALQRNRLQWELKMQLAELKRSRVRLVEAADTERRRLERNLHDGAQQRLVSLSLALRLAQAKLRSDPDSDGAAARAERRRSSSSRCRSCASWPAACTRRSWRIEVSTRRSSRSRTGRRCRSSSRCTALTGSAEPVEVAAFYVVSEALANVAKYSQATCAHVTVTKTDAMLELEVVDDGVGGADPAAGTGLRGLVDRVDALDGRLEVVSPAGRRHPRARRVCRSSYTRPSERHPPLHGHRRVDGARPGARRRLRERARRRTAAPSATRSRRTAARSSTRAETSSRSRSPTRTRRWPRRSRSRRRTGSRVKVRIGIHTGDPLRIDGAYVGVDIHRVARICSAGHGGQVLVSQAACEAAGGAFELARPRRAPPARAEPAGADLPAARPGRARDLSAAAVGGQGSRPRRPHPRRPRRRLGPAARGHRAPARGGGLRGRRPERHRRGPAAEGAVVRTRRRHHRHPDAADAHRRGPPRGAGDPRALPRHRGARAVAVRRVGLRARAAAVERRRRRLPAQGSRRRHRRVRRGREAGRGRRLALDPEVVSMLVGRRRGDDPLSRPDASRARRCSI